MLCVLSSRTNARQIANLKKIQKKIPERITHSGIIIFICSLINAYLESAGVS